MNASPLRWIWNIWRERKGLIILLFFLTLLSSSVAVAYPYLIKVLIDILQHLVESRAGQDQAQRETYRLAGLFILVGITGLIAAQFPGIRGAVNVVFEHLIRLKYFKTIIEQDYRFFSHFRSGDIVTRLTDDIYDFPKLGWFLCSGIFRAVESISKVLFCLGAMFFLNGRLTLLSLLPLPLTILVFAIVQDRIYDSFRRNQEAISDINTQLEQSFSGIRIIKAYACEHKYRRFFDQALQRRYSTEMAVVRLGTILDMIYMYIDYIAQLVVIFVGGYMAVKGSITIGTFYAFYNYLGMLVRPILDIPQLFVSGKRAFVNIDRLEELRTFPQAAQVDKVLPVSTQVRRLRLKNVSFTYPGRQDAALTHITLEVASGERLAILGPVGSGKSTLLKIILGLLDCQSGQVLLDETPLERIDPKDRSRIFGYVPQEALLFSGTIRDNIAFGVDAPQALIPDEDLERLLEIAQLQSEIESFAAGVQTMLGQRGVSVSGGQKQRIAIARALARKPQILLLDDITASLDAANEERLWQALQREYPDMTSIVVSHRLSTLQYVDRVAFLQGGQLAAFGRHEELMHSNELYRAFIQEHQGPELYSPF
ncbi:MAG: ABC transporter ATP-binding protein [Termitinemataceae bacterium]